MNAARLSNLRHRAQVGPRLQLAEATTARLLTALARSRTRAVVVVLPTGDTLAIVYHNRWALFRHAVQLASYYSPADAAAALLRVAHRLSGASPLPPQPADRPWPITLEDPHD